MTDEHTHDHHTSHARQGHAGHSHDRDASEQRLQAALVLLLAFTLVEAVGGFWANSIALLAEAAHMLADSASLLLAIVAIRMGRLPASAEHTYGNHRYQTLAAYTNGLALLALTVWVMVEAVVRLRSPPEVNGKLMLSVAIVGGVANLAAFMVLSGAGSLNERGARAHVLSDLFGSGAATAAACAILFLGWRSADPLLSIAVSVLILKSGWQLTRDAGHVLLQGTPPGFDAAGFVAELLSVPEVCGIHHVHAWSLTGEKPIVTLHAQLLAGADRQKTLAVILQRLHERVGVEHATVQIEEGACASPVVANNCHQPATKTDLRREEDDHSTRGR